MKTIRWTRWAVYGAVFEVFACGGRAEKDGSPPVAVLPSGGASQVVTGAGGSTAAGGRSESGGSVGAVPAAGGTLAVRNGGNTGGADPLPFLFPESPALTEAQRAVNELALAGYQRGVNICQCFPTTNISCIVGESGDADAALGSWSDRGSLDSRRCVSELIEATPGLAEAVICEAKILESRAACEHVECRGSQISLTFPCQQLQPEACSSLPITPEVHAALHACSGAYYCGNVRHDEYLCNGIYECPDHSDEDQCRGNWLDCEDGLRRLNTASKELCDGKKDCANGLDEAHCVAPLGSDAVTVFDCGDGKRVQKGAVCDGIRDCANGQDEAFTCYRK
ncbi:MAG: low-density lipoprotein receptor class A repeat-containing protein [Polyangiaceae bacterium]|nr:low-density lipoprotein receptor class A repeat-containing protein [Polyangiaceae bacterium]